VNEQTPQPRVSGHASDWSLQSSPISPVVFWLSRWEWKFLSPLAAREEFHNDKVILQIAPVTTSPSRGTRRASRCTSPWQPSCPRDSRGSIASWGGARQDRPPSFLVRHCRRLVPSALSHQHGRWLSVPARLGLRQPVALLPNTLPFPAAGTGIAIPCPREGAGCPLGSPSRSSGKDPSKEGGGCLSPVTLVPFSLQQVKTVRFQNHSPPPPKRHSLQPSPSLPRSRTEPAAMAEALLPEASLPGPELATLYSPRASSSPLHPRRALHPKALSLDLSGQLTFPVKKSYSSISAN